MAIEVAWSLEAAEDLESIGRYIERDSKRYANAVIERIVEVGASLSEFPDSGRVVPEFGDPSVRERFVYSYRLIYRVEPTRALIVAVIHGSRLLEGSFGRL